MYTGTYFHHNIKAADYHTIYDFLFGLQVGAWNLESGTNLTLQNDAMTIMESLENKTFVITTILVITLNETEFKSQLKYLKYQNSLSSRSFV